MRHRQLEGDNPMRKILLVVLTLSLAGCANGANPFASITNPVSSTNLYEGDLVYDGALKSFNKLKDLCARRVISSKCRTYVKQAQALIPKVEAARQTAEQFIAANPTIDATSVVSAFTTLVSKFGTSVTQLGTVQ